MIPFLETLVVRVGWCQLHTLDMRKRFDVNIVRASLAVAEDVVSRGGREHLPFEGGHPHVRGQGVQQCGQVSTGDMQVLVHIEATDPLCTPLCRPFDGIDLHCDL